MPDLVSQPSERCGHRVGSPTLQVGTALAVLSAKIKLSRPRGVVKMANCPTFDNGSRATRAKSVELMSIALIDTALVAIGETRYSRD